MSSFGSALSSLVSRRRTAHRSPAGRRDDADALRARFGGDGPAFEAGVACRPVRVPRHRGGAPRVEAVAAEASVAEASSGTSPLRVTFA